jgi:glycosyltransferase involved in cell wall biosynthesis
VITVCFNALKTLPDCVNSVALQSHGVVEHIVIDGASSDGTVEWLHTLDLSHFRFISEPDEGIYHAMNKGWKMARGKWVTFLNADDAWLQDTAELVLRHDTPDAEILYGNLRKERQLNGKWFHRYEKPDISLMPKTMGIFHPATFIRNELFHRLGAYNEKYRFSADYDWLLNAYLAGCRFQYIDAPLAIFRVGGVSTLNCDSYAEGAEILRNRQTGFATELEEAHRLCRRKVALLRTIFTLARLTGTTKWLEKRMQKNWTPNNGNFGA